jgi:hypothetical protein
VDSRTGGNTAGTTRTKDAQVAKEADMYLYSTDGMEGYPQTVGPGIDPIGSQKTVCPLLRHDGRYLEWLDYVLRTKSSDDPLSKYKQFLNEVAYQAYLESCKGDSIEELKKQVKLFPWSKPVVPKLPGVRSPYECFVECKQKVEKCPGGRRAPECQRIGRDCMKECQGAMA